MDVGEDTALGDGDAVHELVELLVVADGELEVARVDARMCTRLHSQPRPPHNNTLATRSVGAALVPVTCCQARLSRRGDARRRGDLAPHSNACQNPGAGTGPCT